MAGEIVLLIHGMGSHKKGAMAKDFREALEEAADGFGVADFNLDESVQIEEFNYSGSLDEIRNKIAENSQQVLDVFPDGVPGPEIISKFLNVEAELSKDEMLYTHWLDVLLYGATFYGEKLRVDLGAKINEIFAARGNKNVHVIAHSLGTALLTDTLDKLYRTHHEDEADYPYLTTGNEKFKSVWTFANVSRMVNMLNEIAEDTPTVLHSGVDGCTQYFYNVCHKLDPFCWFKPVNVNTLDIANGAHLQNEVVRNINTHDFKEYIAAPKPAQYILANICGLHEAADEGEAEKYRKAHKKKSIPDLVKTKMVERWEAYEEEIKEAKSVKDFMKITKKLLEDLEEMIKNAVDNGGDDEPEGDNENDK